jgi:glycosyltransferase involved in cell wall biosynthesis
MVEIRSGVSALPLMPAMTVVVPAFRSPGTLARLCDELEQHVMPLVEAIEVIFVDDGSGDGTWAAIEHLAATRMYVRGISLLRNYGQHNALLAGLQAVSHALVLTIDDDLQNPPDQVPHMLAALRDDIDLVYGSPRAMPHGAMRNFASQLTKRWMAALLGPEVHARSSAFRLFRAELIAAGDHVNDPFVSIDVLLGWATTRTAVVEVDFAPRELGVSGYTFRRLVRHAFNMITGYSTRPLRIASLLGFGAAVLGFGLLIFVLVRFAVGDADVAGFTFLAAAITLFSGVQLFSLGLLGEYVGRIHFRSMGRPPYVIREQVPRRQS